MNSIASDDFLTARMVWERYGVVSITLHRWLRDDRMNFPKPYYFGRNRYWKRRDLEQWEMARASSC